MTGLREEADYKEQVLPEYQGNPLIEALPEIMSREETLSCLTREPSYDKGERTLEAKYRIHCLSRLLHDYYQPLPEHLDIESGISVCLRQGYRNRNPQGRQYALMINESYAAMVEKRPVRMISGYHPNASGFTIIGVSGVGKSTAVESILYQYPQVIEHTEYKGRPLPATQIVWLKLDCPHDGSRGELCYRFFKAIDDALNVRPDYLCRLMESSFGGCLAVEYHDCVVVLFDTASMVLTEQQSFSKLREFLAPLRLSAGISKSFQTLADFRNGYREAATALETTGSQNPGELCFFEDCVLRYMLQNACGTFTISELCPPGLLRLKEYCEKSDVDYLHVLRVWLECNCSASEASRRLYLHRSTFMKRLDRIREILDIDLYDHDNLLLLQLCIRLLD